MFPVHAQLKQLERQYQTKLPHDMVLALIRLVYDERRNAVQSWLATHEVAEQYAEAVDRAYERYHDR